MKSAASNFAVRQKRIILAGAVFWYAVMSQIGSANACSVLPTFDRTKKDFELMIDAADLVFIGRVSHILRRKWTQEDMPPIYPKQWQEYAKKVRYGANVDDNQYLANIVTYAEATAYIQLDSELYWTGLGESRNPHLGPELIPIDMLQPFSVAGHGPCHNFPRTCPWDMKSGDSVVIAAVKRKFGANKALFCEKVPRLDHEQRQEIRQSAKQRTKFGAIEPFVGFLNRTDN